MGRPVDRAVVLVRLPGSRAADYDEEGLGAVDGGVEGVGVAVADVLDLQVVPEVARVGPAVFAGGHDVALVGGELGEEDGVPDAQDGGVVAGLVGGCLVEGLADGGVGEL